VYGLLLVCKSLAVTRRIDCSRVSGLSIALFLRGTLMGYPHAGSLTETRVLNTPQKTGFANVGSTCVPSSSDCAIGEVSLLPGFEGLSGYSMRG